MTPSIWSRACRFSRSGSPPDSSVLSTPRRSADGHKLLLDGEGGDEWLGAPPSLGVELLTSGDLIGLWWLVSARSSYRRRPRRRTMRELVGAVRRTSHEGRQRAGAALAALDHPSTATTAEVLDGLGRHLGARYASPLWEAEVVEAAVGTSARAFVANGRYKAPVRDLVSAAVPSVGRDWPPPVTVGEFAAATLAAHVPAIWQERQGGSLLAELGVSGTPPADSPSVRFDFDWAWHTLCCEGWLRQRL